MTKKYKRKSNLHYTRDITPKHVTSSGFHLCDLARGQHISEEASQRWRAVADTISNLTGSVIDPQISAAMSFTITPTKKY